MSRHSRKGRGKWRPYAAYLSDSVNLVYDRKRRRYAEKILKNGTYLDMGVPMGNYRPLADIL